MLRYGALICIVWGTALGFIAAFAPYNGWPQAVVLPLLMAGGAAGGILARKTDER